MITINEIGNAMTSENPLLDLRVKISALDSRLKMGLKTRVLVDGTRAVNMNPGDDIKTLRMNTKLFFFAFFFTFP